MKVSFRYAKDSHIKCDALVLPVFEDEKTTIHPVEDSIDQEIKRVITAGEFKGSLLEVCLIHSFGRITPDRVFLIGLGKKSDFNDEHLRKCGGEIAVVSSKKSLKTVALSTPHLKTLTIPISTLVEGIILGSYRFDKYRQKKDSKGLSEIILTGKKDRETATDIRYRETVAKGVFFTRDLVNTPSNDLTPSDLASAAKGIKGHGISVKVLGDKDIRKKGMYAFHAVSQGSNQEPAFIVMEYRGGKKGPVVLVGKSVTFDSGGISLKPSEGMEKMKYDMAGGAAVLGVFKVLPELNLPVHVIGILPATENLPGGSATRPGDIVKTISGKTIEIINTDAEGRLTLADGIEFAKKYKPGVIVDIATLTGACSVALGNEAIALMGNKEELMDTMQRASGISGERIWKMPLYEEYRDYLKSDVADIKNTGGRSGSLVTAGYFLKEFAGDTPWLHLDIASTAWTDNDRQYMPKGATGIGVRLLINFLKEYSR